jgi:hypothetical protein
MLLIGLNLRYQCRNLHFFTTLSLLLLPAESSLAPLGRPTLMGQIGNMVWGLWAHIHKHIVLLVGRMIYTGVCKGRGDGRAVLSLTNI